MLRIALFAALMIWAYFGSGYLADLAFLSGLFVLGLTIERYVNSVRHGESREKGSRLVVRLSQGNQPRPTSTHKNS